MKAGRWAMAATLLLIPALLVASCYAIQRTKKAEDGVSSSAVSAELHGMIVDYVEEALYTYPHVATRVGLHVYELPNGERIDLDRELPNFSDEVVSARVEKLEAYLERLTRKVPGESLSLNDQADRRLLEDAVLAEIHQLSVLKVHTRNPIVHVAALAEAIYYPMVLEYAPEPERLADVLGRLHWLPSYADRAIRMLGNSSEAYHDASVAINRQTVELVRDVLAKRVEAAGDEELTKSFAGIQPPVLESLKKLQEFLEQDLPKKAKRTWRLGEEKYGRLFALSYHGLASAEEAAAAARDQIAEIRRQMFGVAKPVYCEHHEKDREVCGPTKAEIAAAKAAEEKRLRKEEEARQRAEAEERKRREEEQKKAEAAKKEAEEKKKAEAAKKEAEEKKKASEGKADKEEKEIINPYGGKKKEEKQEPKEGPVNPYSFLLPPPAEIIGAKVAGQDPPQGDDEGATKAGKDETEDSPLLENIGGVKPEDASDEMIQKVVSWALNRAAKTAGKDGEVISRIEGFVSEMADQARSIDLLSTVKSSRLDVAEMPTCLSEFGRALELVPQPVFHPEQGARLFVALGGAPGPSAWDNARLKLLTAIHAGPGQLEVYRRAAAIQMQTRRVMRMLYADQAFVRGWALYAASQVAQSDDSWVVQLTGQSLVLSAAADLLVDVQLHTGDLSDREAAQLLVDRAFTSPKDAEARTHRSRLTPSALAAPFLGYQAWRVTRGKVQDKLKQNFSRQGFHEDALDLGPVPLSLLIELLTSDDPDAAPEHDMTAHQEGEESTYSFVGPF